MANPIPKETQAAKLSKFKRYLSEDHHRQGTLAYKSHRQIALDLNLSTFTVSNYLKLHYPSVAFQMRKLRSR